MTVSNGVTLDAPVTLGFTKLGSGTLQPGNGNAFGTGALAANGGVLDLSGNSATVGALNQGTLTASSVLDLNGYSVAAGSFSGAAGLTKTGAGLLTLTSSSNSYSGPTTVNNGQLVVNGSLFSSSAAASTTTHSGVTVQTANPNLAAGRIILNGEQQFGGQGNYAPGQVTAANTFTGNTTISSGTLQMGNGASTGGITFNGGTLQWAEGNTLQTYAGAISGNGSLSGNGALIVNGGSLTVNGASSSGTFSGTITNNGVLAFNNATTQYVPAQKTSDRDDQQRELAEYQQKLAKDNGTLAFNGQNRRPGARIQRRQGGLQAQGRPALGCRGSTSGRRYPDHDAGADGGD